MASSIARGHLRTTTRTTTSRIMAAILQLLGCPTRAALLLVYRVTWIFDIVKITIKTFRWLKSVKKRHELSFMMTRYTDRLP